MHFIVVAAYTGECCPDAHVWAKRVRAGSVDEAIATMRRLIRKEGNEPADIAVLADTRIELVVGKGEGE